MDARNVGSRVRVRIWVSANVGPIQLNDHFLGTFYVRDGQTLLRQVNVEIATIQLVLKAKNQVVEAVIKMQGAMFTTQQRVLEASISG